MSKGGDLVTSLSSTLRNSHAQLLIVSLLFTLMVAIVVGGFFAGPAPDRENETAGFENAPTETDTPELGGGAGETPPDTDDAEGGIAEEGESTGEGESAGEGESTGEGESAGEGETTGEESSGGEDVTEGAEETTGGVDTAAEEGGDTERGTESDETIETDGGADSVDETESDVTVGVELGGGGEEPAEDEGNDENGTDEEEFDEAGGTGEDDLGESGGTGEEEGAPGAENGSGQPSTDVTSCRNITEPGTYDVRADLHASSQPCLHVTTSDVTIDGNGHTIAGSGLDQSDRTDPADSGIWIFDEDDPHTAALDNVTVRDVQVRGWGAGIRSGRTFTHQTTLTIENVTVSGSGVGIAFSELDDATVTDVVLEDNVVGLSATESRMVTLSSSTVRNNAETGVFAGQASPMTVTDSTISGNGQVGLFISNEGAETLVRDVTIADNGGHGVAQGNDVSHTRIVASKITNNGGAGIDTVESSTVSVIRDVIVSGNQRQGIHFGAGTGVEATDLRNVTVRENGGLEIDSLDRTVSAGDLRVGSSATFEFEGESATFEPVASDAIPSLPGNATAVSPGVNLTGVAGPVQMALTRTEPVPAGSTVETWRHDGSSWSTVAQRDGSDGATVESELSTGGIYVLVAVPEE